MKKVIKIRELPPKIKEIKEDEEKSELEENVEEASQEVVSNFFSEEPSASAEEIAPSLSPVGAREERQNESRESFLEESKANEQSDRLYGGLRANENKREYVESKQRTVVPTMNEESRRILQPRSLFEDSSMRAQQPHSPESETKYYEFKQEGPRQSRRRYPWEANNR